MLQVPTRMNQFGCETIQEFRANGSRAAHTKIVTRAHQSAPEMVMPNPVHQHAGDDGILRRSQPSGQGQSTVRGMDRWLLGSHGTHGRLLPWVFVQAGKACTV